MRTSRELLFFWIAIAFLISSFRCFDGRSHFHKPKPHHEDRRRHLSLPPLPSPYAEPPTSGMNVTDNSTISQAPLPSPYTKPPSSGVNATHNSTVSQAPLPSPHVETPASNVNATNNSTISPLPSPYAEPPASNVNATSNSTVSQVPLPSPNAEPPTPNVNATSNSTVSQAPVPSPYSEPPASSTNSTNNSTSNPCIVNVRSFGAVGDGETDDTQAFRSAWKAACSVDNGVLLVPMDGIFTITSTIFSGPCSSGFVFQVDGVLMPPDGPECWPESDSKRQWLVFYRVDGMTLRGRGKIEGNGEKGWNLPCKPHRGPNGSTLPGPCDSPALIRFFMSSNLTVRDLRIENSPQFHVKFDGCNGVHIEGILISSPALSPNTDGIHIENTKEVGIYNSKISNGDDCISIGTGCSNVDIENVTCGPSHGISIGSLGVHNSQACVSNIKVRNTVIRNSDNGLRIKTWQGGMGTVSGISFDDVYMENVKNCIIIDQYYCLSKGCTNQTSAVYVSDVSYSNIKGTYDVMTPPIHFACSDSVPCTNITMSEVELLPFEGELVDDPFCWNAYGVQETLTIPPISCLQDGMPQSLQESYNFGC